MNNTNPFDSFAAYSGEFTKTDRMIYEHIKENPTNVITYNVSSIAHVIGVSDAAIVRFAHKVGYNGFSALKNDISRYIFSRNAHEDGTSQNSETTNPLIAITSLYAKYINAIADCTDMEAINHVARLYLDAKRVKIVAINRTANSARQFRMRLGKMGYDAELVDDNIVFGDVSNYVGEGDLIILFTTKNNIGYGPEVENCIENKAKVVVFTMSHNLPFRNICDEVIVLPRISRDSRVSFLDDQAIFFVFIEVLLDAIAELGRE